VGSIEAAGARRVRAPRRGSDYAELLTRVRQAGLLDRRPAYYTYRIALGVVLLIGGWTAFVLVGDSWWQLVTAGYLAAVFTQLGSSATRPVTASRSGRAVPTGCWGCCSATSLARWRSRVRPGHPRCR
jgi:hypothetical protein